MRRFFWTFSALTIAGSGTSVAQTRADSVAAAQAYADRVSLIADSAHYRMKVLTLLQEVGFDLAILNPKEHPFPFSMDSLYELTRARQAEVRQRYLAFDVKDPPPQLEASHRPM